MHAHNGKRRPNDGDGAGPLGGGPGKATRSERRYGGVDAANTNGHPEQQEQPVDGAPEPQRPDDAEAGGNAADASHDAPANAGADKAEPGKQDTDSAGTPGKQSGVQPEPQPDAGVKDGADAEGNDDKTTAEPDGTAKSDTASEPDATAESDTSPDSADPDGMQMVIPELMFGGLLAPPPALGPKQDARLAEETGMDSATHHGAVQADIDRLGAMAKQLQKKLAVHGAAMAASAAAGLAGDKQKARTAVATAESQIGTAFESARTKVNENAAAAVAIVEASTVAGEALILAATSRECEASSVQHDLGAAQLTTLEATEQAQMYAEIETHITKHEADIAIKSAAMATAGANKATGLWGDSSSVARAKAEQQSKVVSKMADSDTQTIGALGATQKTALRAQGNQFIPLIPSMLAGLRMDLLNRSLAQGIAIGNADKKAKAQLAADRTTALAEIETTRKAAIAKLDEEENKAVAGVKAAGAKLQTSIAARESLLGAQLTGAAATLSHRYGEIVDGVSAALSAQGLVTHEDAQPAIVAAEAKLRDAHTANTEALNGKLAVSLGAVQGAIATERGGLGKAGTTAASEAKRIGTTQAQALIDSAKPFSDGLVATAGMVEKAMVDFVAPNPKIRETLQAQSTAELANLRGGVGALLGLQQLNAGLALQQFVDTFGARANPAIDAAGKEVLADLNARAGKAYTAMQGVGTDEVALMKALEKMTARQGNAVEAIYNTHKTPVHGSSFRNDLREELDDGRYNAARAYLRGDQATGARLEMEASISWHGDDEARIREIAENLSEKDIAQLDDDPAWAATKARLKSNLSGADEDVTLTFAKGEKARGYAFKYRDEVATLVAKDDFDGLHALLEDMPKDSKAEILREFADIEGADAGEDPAQVFAAYVTDRHYSFGIDGMLPVPTPSMTAHQVTGANKDLAEALVYQDFDEKDPDKIKEQQVAVEAARLGVEAQRAGGPDLTKLDDIPADRLDDVIARYGENYHEDDVKDGASAADLLEGDFVDALDSWDDWDEADDERIAEGIVNGHINPADALAHAMEGPGTIDKLAKHALAGKTPDEIDQIAADYKERTGRDLREDLAGDFSGDDWHEMDILMMGEPTNDQEAYLIAKKKYEWEKEESGVLGGFIGEHSDEGEMLEHNYEEMERLLAESDGFDGDGNLTGGNSEEFSQYVTHTGQAAKHYNDNLDNITEVATGVVAADIAISAAVLTGGGAIPAELEVAAAMATAAYAGAMQMGAKELIEGGKYGWEEVSADLAKHGVEVASAGASKAIAPAGADVGGEVLAGLLSGGGGEALKAMLDDSTYEKGGAEAIAKIIEAWEAGAASGGVSAGVAGGLKGLGPVEDAAKSGQVQKAVVGGFADMLGDASGKTSAELIKQSSAGDVNDAAKEILKSAGIEGLKSALKEGLTRNNSENVAKNESVVADDSEGSKAAALLDEVVNDPATTAEDMEKLLDARTLAEMLELMKRQD